MHGKPFIAGNAILSRMTVKIREKTLQVILEAAKNAYPREFLGLLRAEDGVITEILVAPMPRFEIGRSSMRLDMKPLDPSIVGSVHSHPGSARPSKADMHFFSKFGRVHLIIGYPFAPCDIWVLGGDELEIVK